MFHTKHMGMFIVCLQTNNAEYIIRVAEMLLYMLQNISSEKLNIIQGLILKMLAHLSPQKFARLPVWRYFK
jgi:hypothetical protein